MKEETKQIIKELQEEIKKLESLKSNIEVVWQLEKLSVLISEKSKQLRENL